MKSFAGSVAGMRPNGRVVSVSVARSESPPAGEAAVSDGLSRWGRDDVGQWRAGRGPARPARYLWPVFVAGMSGLDHLSAVTERTASDPEGPVETRIAQ